MKINYLIISDSFNEQLSNEQATFNQALQDFIEILEILVSDETICYSIDLYDQIFYNGQTLVEWLYTGTDMFHDERRLIQLKLKKMIEWDKSEILNTISQLQNREYKNFTSLITFHHLPVSNIETSIVIQDKGECLQARRFYLHFAEDGSIFLDECMNCFPQLFINGRVQQTIKRFKPFRDYIAELIIHLTALNDHGLRLFQEYQSQSEAVVLQHLGTIGNIHCSPQGDSAYEKANLSFDFPSDEGGTVKVVCAPHTKLFEKHSSDRIYFTWGHPRVKNGKMLLIGHIGDHL
jgi:hypothetical protein